MIFKFKLCTEHPLHRAVIQLREATSPACTCHLFEPVLHAECRK